MFSSAKTTSIAVGDTLWYFFNKQKFINTPANQTFLHNSGFCWNYYTNGDLVEFGSSFLNTSANSPITVGGALILVSKQANSTSASIPVRVYLYNATTTRIAKLIKLTRLQST